MTDPGAVAARPIPEVVVDEELAATASPGLQQLSSPLLAYAAPGAAAASNWDLDRAQLLDGKQEGINNKLFINCSPRDILGDL